MKKLLFFLLAALPFVANAQNTWETEDDKTEDTKAEAPNPDAKYLEGAVPEVDGRVVFKQTINAEGKSAREIYNICGRTISAITKEDNQLETSRIVLADTAKNQICANIEEWLVFKNNAIALDRTKFKYNIIVNCGNGTAEIMLTRISYLYDEERNAQRYTAEEWITDKYALRKNKQALVRLPAKFRRKTIDRKDYLFKLFEEKLSE